MPRVRARRTRRRTTTPSDDANAPPFVVIRVGSRASVVLEVVGRRSIDRSIDSMQLDRSIDRHTHPRSIALHRIDRSTDTQTRDRQTRDTQTRDRRLEWSSLGRVGEGLGRSPVLPPSPTDVASTTARPVATRRRRRRRRATLVSDIDVARHEKSAV